MTDRELLELTVKQGEQALQDVSDPAPVNQQLLEFAKWVLSLKTGGIIEGKARAAIAEAITQSEIQTDTLERKDAALRVALEALQSTGGDWVIKEREAIAKIKGVLG